MQSPIELFQWICIQDLCYLFNPNRAEFLKWSCTSYTLDTLS